MSSECDEWNPDNPDVEELFELLAYLREATVQTKAATKDFQDTMWCRSALDGLDK